MLDEHHDNKPADNNDRVQSLTEIRKFQVHDGKKGTNDIKIIKKELNFARKRLSYYKKVNKQIQDDYIRVSNKISELEVALETSSKAMALVEKIKRNSCIDREIDIQTAGYLFTDVREIHAKSHLRGFRIHSAWQYTIQTPFSTEFCQKDIEYLVLQDLMQSVLPSCGCENWADRNFKGIYSDVLSILLRALPDNYDEDDIAKRETHALAEGQTYVFDWRFHADFTQKYWQVEICTTKELDVPMIFKTKQMIPKKGIKGLLSRLERKNSNEETDASRLE